MPVKNILVTGANGQLGSEFHDITHLYPGYNFFFTGKEQLPITDAKAILEYFRSNKMDVCINCAAYTAVDKAESEADIANDVNGHAVGFLADICAQHNTKLFHFSTDYVFDGRGKQPYLETDSVSPVNIYGASKLLGEELATKKNKDAIIIRTSWVYGYHGKNFVKTMMRLMQEKESLSVVNDQLGSPTYARDLAEAVMNIIVSDKFEGGIYHYANAGIISWYDFAVAIRQINNYDCDIKPVTSAEFPTPARRPSNSAMDTSKFKDTFQIQIPAWKESLEKCIERLKIKN